MRKTPQTEERLRFTHGCLAILLIASYVFHFPWVAIVLACIVGISIAVGPQADFIAWPFDKWLASRIKRPNPMSDAHRKLVMLSQVGLLAVSTLLWAAGIEGVAELVSLVAAGIALIYATTGIVIPFAIDKLIRRQR